MTDIKAKDRAEEVALFRAEIIGALSRQDLPRGALRAALRELREKHFRPPRSKITRTFSVPTLERWYYRYRATGLDGLRPSPRSDRGRAQELTPEQRTLLCDIRREHPGASPSGSHRLAPAHRRVRSVQNRHSRVQKLHSATHDWRGQRNGSVSLCPAVGIPLYPQLSTLTISDLIACQESSRLATSVVS